MKRTDYRTPLAIPQGQAGEFEITHCIKPAGEPVMMNNFRNQFFGAQKGPNVLTWPTETRWHELSQGGGVWMTDLPVEQRQMDASIRGMKGRVLVGGLGLGYAVQALYAKRAVKEVVVVEIAPEVVSLVSGHIKVRYPFTVVTQDLLEYLKGYDGPPFDYAFYDIWASDGEGTFFETVVPLLQMSQNKVLHRPVCWNEQIMRGQLIMSLHQRVMFCDNPDLVPAANPKFKPWEYDGTDRPWHNWAVRYHLWYKDRQPTNPGPSIVYYCQNYGIPGWEEIWDAYAEIHAKKGMTHAINL